MSEPVGTAAAANSTAQLGVVVTAGADTSNQQSTGQGQQLAPPVATIHPLVSAVVTGVQATQAPTSNWAQTAAAVLMSMMQMQPQIFAITRSSPKTQAILGLGEETLALALAAFFPHPNG